MKWAWHLGVWMPFCKWSRSSIVKSSFGWRSCYYLSRLQMSYTYVFFPRALDLSFDPRWNPPQMEGSNWLKKQIDVPRLQQCHQGVCAKGLETCLQTCFDALIAKSSPRLASDLLVGRDQAGIVKLQCSKHWEYWILAQNYLTELKDCQGELDLAGYWPHRYVFSKPKWHRMTSALMPGWNAWLLQVCRPMRQDTAGSLDPPGAMGTTICCSTAGDLQHCGRQGAIWLDMWQSCCGDQPTFKMTKLESERFLIGETRSSYIEVYPNHNPLFVACRAGCGALGSSEPMGRPSGACLAAGDKDRLERWPKPSARVTGNEIRRHEMIAPPLLASFG